MDGLERGAGEPAEEEPQPGPVGGVSADEPEAVLQQTRYLNSSDRDPGEAIRLAIANRMGLVLIDAASKTSSQQMPAPESTGSTVRIVHRRAVPGGGMAARLMAHVSWWVQRCLLGTGKHDRNEGWVAVGAAHLRRIGEAGFRPTNAAQLAAAAHALRFPTAETSFSAAGVPAIRVTAREIARQFGDTIQFWWQSIAFPEPKPACSEGPNVAEVDGDGAMAWLGNWLTTGLLALVALVIFFASLEYPLFEPDETRNAQLALNILSSGDWMALTLDGEPYWDKPPLQAWLTACSYRFLGAGAWSTRVPSALAGWLTFLAVVALGGRLAGSVSAWLGGALLLMSTGFVLSGRFATMDQLLTLCSTTMLISALLAVRSKALDRRWLTVAGLACGMGLLAKGPVILVLVLPPVTAAAWLSGWRNIRRWQFWLWPAAIAVLVAAPWYVAMAIQHPGFVGHFFWRHNVVRFSEGFNHRQPLWFYLPVILLAMFPASFLFPAGLRTLVSGRSLRRRLVTRTDGALLLMVVWVVAFFSLSKTKLPSYVLPALPVLALLLGRVAHLARKTGPVQLLPRSALGLQPWHLLAWAGVAGLVAIGLGAADIASRRELSIPWAGPLLLGAACMGGWLALRRKMSNQGLAWGATLACGISFTGVMLQAILPEFARDRSLHNIVARTAGDPGCESWPILYYGERTHASTLVMPDGSVAWLPLDAAPEVAEFLASHPRSILVTHPFNVEQLRKQLSDRVRIESASGQRKVYFVEAQKAPVRISSDTGPADSDIQR